MNEYIFWIIQLITTAAIGAIAYFLKDIKATITADIKKNDERVRTLEKEVYALPEKYVLKEDYQVTIRNIDKKFDNIDGKLDKIIDKMSR